jgi:hypothetical protein
MRREKHAWQAFGWVIAFGFMFVFVMHSMVLKKEPFYPFTASGPLFLLAWRRNQSPLFHPVSPPIPLFEPVYKEKHATQFNPRSRG